ncbi:DUF5706 domain-containing protein [Rhodocytophaga aerolata]|uniref:DUF5706 domain-containing protein n=2 Tax=Rhodocytophaga aerolata TaxID=455078 RepID=A0ABT8RBG3_9BACT|nr:DUF5706 domain-containing protein [Rhodocytophaga aerolata]
MNAIVNILPQVETQVIHLFTLHQMPELPYHNLAHTQQVVQAVQQMAKHYMLEEEKALAVTIAAWFHDVGHLVAPTEGHEEKSIEMATSFLQAQNVAQEIIEQVQGCIRATHLPQQPHNLVEQILCDADLFHLGTPDFDKNSQLLRQEKELLTGEKIKGSQWRTCTIEFLLAHQYFTSYATQLLEKQKKQHLQHLQQKQATKERHKQKGQQQRVNARDVEKAEKKKKKHKNDLGRDITTMFRITSSNHINLGEMADRKARIMISVNSILVSVIVSLLIRRLHENTYLIIPTVLFLVTGVITIIFSVLAARPSAGSGRFEPEEVARKKGNLLFFGNFYKMELAEYKAGMNTLMSDREYLYGSMTEDIFRMGVLLGHKYRLLRIAYNVFMVGFALAVATYISVIVLFR